MQKCLDIVFSAGEVVQHDAAVTINSGPTCTGLYMKLCVHLSWIQNDQNITEEARSLIMSPAMCGLLEYLAGLYRAMPETAEETELKMGLQNAIKTLWVDHMQARDANKTTMRKQRAVPYRKPSLDPEETRARMADFERFMARMHEIGDMDIHEDYWSNPDEEMEAVMTPNADTSLTASWLNVLIEEIRNNSFRSLTSEDIDLVLSAQVQTWIDRLNARRAAASTSSAVAPPQVNYAIVRDYDTLHECVDMFSKEVNSERKLAKDIFTANERRQAELVPMERPREEASTSMVREEEDKARCNGCSIM